MIKKLRTLVFILGIMLGGGAMVPLTVNAASPLAAQCADDPESTVCQGQNATPQSLIKTIVNVLLYIIGGVSVIMLIVGGLMYTTSAGDSGRVTTAKNTLLGAVIGLVVSILAFAIVQFVFTRFK